MKKYKLMFILILSFIPLLGWNQQKVKTLEFELGGGYSIAAKNNKNLGAGQVFIELRNNFPVSKFDFGVQLCLTGTMKGEPNNLEKFNPKLNETGTYLMPVADYNFFRGEE